MPAPQFDLIDLHPHAASLEEEVLSGLSAEARTLPPKLFYDEAGSHLFEEITELPEYYLTRTEAGILTRIAPEIAAMLEPRSALVELGSGASTKVRLLLDRGPRPLTYMPLDISRTQLESAARRISSDYPDVAVVAVCTDYAKDLTIPATHLYSRRLIFFPGSTIGNFDPDEAREFLRQCASHLVAGDVMIIGVDLRKDKRVLDAAYDDAAGVTARFNLNLLVRLNRELGADFDLASFEHVAFYDERQSRIEMHLRSLTDQTVHVAGRAFRFSRGECIHTENSYKYDIEGFRRLGTEGGFQPLRVWTDPAGLFSVHAFGISLQSPVSSLQPPASSKGD